MRPDFSLTVESFTEETEKKKKKSGLRTLKKNFGHREEG